MINIAVCDDSETSIEHVEKMLDQLRDSVSFEHEIFTSGEELLQYRKTQNKHFNIYLLDIEIPGMDGITLAKKIRIEEKTAVIVFITSHTDYVFDVFDVVAFHYLVKPVKQKQFDHVILRAIEYLNMTTKLFHFSFNKNQFCLSSKDIIYFEKKSRKVEIHTKDKVFECYLSTNEILDKVDERVFAKISCSFILNLEYVSKIYKGDVHLINGEHFPISKSNKMIFKQKHFLYVDKRSC